MDRLVIFSIKSYTSGSGRLNRILDQHELGLNRKNFIPARKLQRYIHRPYIALSVVVKAVGFVGHWVVFE